MNKLFGKVSDRNLAVLCGASFLMSTALGVFLVALPFVVKRMGGTDGDVGLSMSLNFGAYLAACMAGILVLDRFNAKRVLQGGSTGILVSFGGIVLTILYAAKLGSAIWVLNFFSAMLGVLTAMFWPPIMGWISRGYEGKELSYRLGSFNMSWSTGSWISPYLGGLLVGYNSFLPMAAATGVAGLCIAGINMTRNPERTLNIGPGEQPGEKAVEEGNVNARRFVWMARLALLLSFVAIGVMRSQLGLLFKFKLGYSEANYGLAITIMCLANFAMFWAAGRNHSWHYRVWPFAAAQVFIAVSMVMILGCSLLLMMFAAAAVVGLAEAFIYSSHLFYGVSGAKNRSGLMAVHELLLSLGMMGGALAGGYISDAYGRYMPYWLGMWTVLGGLVVQGAVWVLIGPERKRVCEENASQMVESA